MGCFVFRTAHAQNGDQSQSAELHSNRCFHVDLGYAAYWLLVTSLAIRLAASERHSFCSEARQAYSMTSRLDSTTWLASFLLLLYGTFRRITVAPADA